MLRKQAIPVIAKQQTVSVKRKTCDTKKKIPLGSKKRKAETEKELESLVLGGEDQIIEVLERLDKKEETKSTAWKRQVTHEKRPAWEDEDDDIGSIKFSSAKRFTGIKREEEKIITKKEYKHRLKSQFEKVSSTPNWAKLPSEREKNSDDDDSDVEELLQKTGTFITSSLSLPASIINFQPCTNINKERPLKGVVKCLEFHPSAQVALTGGMNQTLSLFQVDGKTNPHIQSFFIEKYPVLCAHFTRDGEQVVMGSKHRNFKYLDMIAGKVVPVQMKGTEEERMEKFEVSPDGRYLVFLGQHGRMHFISSKAKELLFTLQMNGGVKSIAFSSDSKFMYSHGDESQVYVWDLTTRDCIHRFMDEGCTHGTTIDVSPNNQYVACGSNTGVVNLYEHATCLKSFEPKPIKAIMNLTSSCDITKFNPTSEVLAIGSSEEYKAVKLVHVSSQTVFSNFPERTQTQFKSPVNVDFSVNSGYFSIGTSKGKALLYRLKHYGNY